LPYFIYYKIVAIVFQFFDVKRDSTSHFEDFGFSLFTFSYFLACSAILNFKAVLLNRTTLFITHCLPFPPWWYRAKS